jgi:hypothetical protein
MEHTMVQRGDFTAGHHTARLYTEPLTYSTAQPLTKWGQGAMAGVGRHDQTSVLRTGARAEGPPGPMAATAAPGGTKPREDLRRRCILCMAATDARGRWGGGRGKN